MKTQLRQNTLALLSVFPAKYLEIQRKGKEYFSGITNSFLL